MTEEQKARLKELKDKGELTNGEKEELAELNRINSGKTFTQDEVNGIVTKESRKAVEKVLKELGVENLSNAKDGLKQLKELQNKDKTDLEKITSERDELLDKIKQLNGVNSQNDIKIALLGKGVTEENLQRYTKLYGTYEGDSIEDNMKSLFEEFPIEPPKTQDPPPSLGGKSGSDTGEKTMEQLQAEMDQIMGVS